MFLILACFLGKHQWYWSDLEVVEYVWSQKSGWLLENSKSVLFPMNHALRQSFNTHFHPSGCYGIPNARGPPSCQQEASIIQSFNCFQAVLTYTS